jgi:hypothetical protein
LLKSDETYPTFKYGLGGAGGLLTIGGSHGALRVDTDIRKPFLWEICRICLADIGLVKVWKGRTVGAAGTGND